MLAAFVARTGGADALDNLDVAEQPAPRLRDGWGLVRVEAASLNHHDLWTLRGVSSRPVRPPQILGCDAAGVVVEYAGEPPPAAPEPGSRVVVHSPVSCGVCVMCRRDQPLLCRALALLSEGDNAGTFAELVQAPAANLVALGEGIAADHAACLPTAWLTAYRALFTSAAITPGSTALVQGASGGVATAALQLCRAAGVAVIVSSRSAAKREAALALGAIAALPLPPEPGRDGARRWAREVQGLTGGAGADAVIETVGAPTWELSLRAVRPGGTVVVSGATAGDAPAQLARIFWRQVAVVGSTMGTREELERLVALCEATGTRPLIDSVAPLAQARGALERLAAGEQRGKLVLRPGG